jgi:hypothetical protein
MFEDDQFDDEAKLTSWDSDWANGKEIYRNVARTAIRAMREFTKEMAEAGATTLDDCTVSDWGSTPDGGREDYTYVNSDAPGLIWKAMIDAALADAGVTISNSASHETLP